MLVHTRNNLFIDKVLPIQEDGAASLIRRKRHLEPSGYELEPVAALEPSLLTSLQAMSTILGKTLTVSLMVEMLCVKLGRELNPTVPIKLKVRGQPRLSTILEEAEPQTPSSAQSGSISLWSPVKKIADSIKWGIGKLSPSPSPSKENQLPDSRPLSLSPPSDSLTKKETSSTSASTPVHVFTNGGALSINPSGDTRHTESSSLRSRSGEEDGSDMSATFEDSMVQQLKYRDLRSVRFDFSERTDSFQLLDSNETSPMIVDTKTNLDIFNRKSFAVAQSLAKVAEQISHGSVDAKVVVEREGSRLFVRFKMPARFAAFFPQSNLPGTPIHDDTDATIGDEPESPLDRKTSKRPMINGGREVVGWATSPNDSSTLLATPRVSVSGAESVEGTPLEDVSFLSTNKDELIAGLPDTPTAIVLGGEGGFVSPGFHVAPELLEDSPIKAEKSLEAVSPSTDFNKSINEVPQTPAKFTRRPDFTPRFSLNRPADPSPLRQVQNAEDVETEDESFMSTNTDELVNDLPNTPTAIVLNSEWNTPRYNINGQNSPKPESEQGDGHSFFDMDTEELKEVMEMSIPSIPHSDNDATYNIHLNVETPTQSPSGAYYTNSIVEDPTLNIHLHHQSSPMQESGTDEASFLSTNTDQLVGDLPDTPTAVVLNAEFNSPRYNIGAQAVSSPSPQIQTQQLKDTSSVARNDAEIIASQSDTHPELALGDLMNTPPRQTITQVGHDGILIEDSPSIAPHAEVAKSADQAAALCPLSSPSKPDKATVAPFTDTATPTATVTPSKPTKLSPTPPTATAMVTKTATVTPSKPTRSSPPATPSVEKTTPTTPQSSTPDSAHGAEQSVNVTPSPKEKAAENPTPSTPTAHTPIAHPETTPATIDAKPIAAPLRPQSHKASTPTHVAETPKTMTAIPSMCALNSQVSENATPLRSSSPQKQGSSFEPGKGSCTPQSSRLTRPDDLAEAQEAEDRAYLGKFLNQHKASKAAKSAETQARMATTLTGSPAPRLPLGHIDANSSSPKKAGTKRKVGDVGEAKAVDAAEPPAKRTRSSGAPKVAPLRRSSRVKSRAQEPSPDGNSRIPVRVGSGVVGGGSGSREADLAAVTRANTRRNKGKAQMPEEVLARQREDPHALRMQELKEVHDARVARAGKAETKKAVSWGEDERFVYEEEEEDEEMIAAPAPEPVAKGTPVAKRRVGRPQKPAAAKSAAKSASSGSSKSSAKAATPTLTQSAGVKKPAAKKGPVKPKVGAVAVPTRRLTRSSTRSGQ